jgi:GT2 family glycosyltransferase
MDAHIVILNYNGIDILKRYLPKVMQDAGRASCSVKVTVLDNRSTDASVNYIKENFPSVNAVVAKKNLVLASYNDFLKTIPEKVVFLLNNDAYMAPGCIDRLMARLEDSSVFVAAPKVLDMEGANITGGCMDLSVRAGLFRNRLKNTDQNDYTLFIGSTAAYNREKFLALGGYDDIYLPGTYEDIDLCYRAWQRGWFCVYEEDAVAYHEDSASFKKVYGDRKRQAISARNAYLFIWKNIHDPFMLTVNILLFLPLFVFNVLRLRFDLASGGVNALKLLPEVLARRKEAKPYIRRSDREIKKLFKKIHQ